MPTIYNVDQFTYNGDVYKIYDNTGRYITSNSPVINSPTINNAVKITVAGDPTQNLQVATKQYVDNHSSGGSGGGTINDSFKTVRVTNAGSSTNIVASGEDTLKLTAGSNITLNVTNNVAGNKELVISSTASGGGSGGSQSIVNLGIQYTDEQSDAIGEMVFTTSGITSNDITTALGFTPYNSTNPSGYTTNTGTVTKVTVGSDLKVGSTAGGNFTTTGTISHTNSITAGTAGTSSATSGSTLAVPYVTYDANGHITGTGTHTHTITGFATTDNDTKVSTAAVTSGTTYYPTVGTDTTSAATKYYDKTGYAYKGTNGSTSAVGTSILTLGNSTASGTANNKKGQLALYGSTAYLTTIDPGAPTAARTLTLPNASGTIALTSNIPTVPSNVSAFTNDAGYTTNTGTVTGVKINGQTMNPTNGIVDLGNIQTSSGSLNINYNADDAATDGAGIAEVTFSGSGGSVNPATYQTDFKHATISSGDSNYTNVLSFTLSAGIWIVHAFLRIAGESTSGVRSMCVSETSGGNYDTHASNVDVTTAVGLANKNNASSTITTAAPGGKYAQLHITKIYNLSEEKTYYINGYHTAGASKNCVAGYTAIKLA